MEKIKKTLNTEDMIYIIKELLSLSTQQTFTMESFFSNLEIKFSGDQNKVKMEIIRWLAYPEKLKINELTNIEYERVLRIIEYIGPREWVKETIDNSIHMTRMLSITPKCQISAATIGTFPELLDYDADF